MEFLFNAEGELDGVQVDPVSILSFLIVLLNTWMTREVLREAILSKFESLKIREWLIGIPDETGDE